MKTENMFIWIIGIFTIAFSGLLFLVYISEFINVTFLEEIENYPFGCECIDRFSYKSVIHYSIASLLYSLIFLVTSLLGLKSILKKKTKIVLLTFFILIIGFICQFYI